MKLNQILQGDTFEILQTLPNEFVDLCVTSPPYNKRITKGSSKSIMAPIKYDCIDDNLPEEEYQESQVNVIDQLYRVTKPGGSLFYNHKVRHLKGILYHPMEWLTKTKWHMRQEIIWDRGGPVEVGGYRFYQVDERIYWLYKPFNDNVIGQKLLSKHARCSSIWKFSPDKKNSHPAPFPLELPLRSILSILDESPGVILDPYMGSGTTAVASKLLNKEYLGIELSEKTIEQANERIKNFDSERRKLLKELEIHKVVKSWQERKKEKTNSNNVDVFFS